MLHWLPWVSASDLARSRPSLGLSSAAHFLWSRGVAERHRTLVSMYILSSHAVFRVHHLHTAYCLVVFALLVHDLYVFRRWSKLVVAIPYACTACMQDRLGLPGHIVRIELSMMCTGLSCWPDDYIRTTHTCWCAVCVLCSACCFPVGPERTQ